MVWILILERKEVQAREREGKGNSASKLFSNNADLRRPTFENLPLVKECVFFPEKYKSSPLEFWGSFSSVETFLAFVLQLCQWTRDKERKLIHRSEIKGSGSIHSYS